MSRAAAALKKRIFEKETPLCVAADTTKADELIAIAEATGPYICLLKTHVDLLQDFTPSVVEKLQSIALKEQFYFFEDRKFADIAKVSKGQYTKGFYDISSWAHFTTVHPLVGSNTLLEMEKSVEHLTRGVFLICQMSHLKDYFWEQTTNYALDLAQKHRDFVAGFITQKKVTEDQRFIHLTPGVHLQQRDDGMGQNFRTPYQALHLDGCDVIIVGRGITESSNMAKQAKKYLLASYCQTTKSPSGFY